MNNHNWKELPLFLSERDLPESAWLGHPICFLHSDNNPPSSSHLFTHPSYSCPLSMFIDFAIVFLLSSYQMEKCKQFMLNLVGKCNQVHVNWCLGCRPCLDFSQTNVRVGLLTKICCNSLEGLLTEWIASWNCHLVSIYFSKPVLLYFAP